VNLTDDELLLWARFGQSDGWVLLYGPGPDATRLRLQRFSRTADAAGRFWELCHHETAYVRVVRVTDGEARFVGRAFQGHGSVNLLNAP
jgi:hypothetical protein